jgi:hypothetical protein
MENCEAQTGLHWLMASYSGTDVYGPNRYVFVWEDPQTGNRFWNCGSRNREQWRIGLRHTDGTMQSWSETHYESLAAARAVR